MIFDYFSLYYCLGNSEFLLLFFLRVFFPVIIFFLTRKINVHVGSPFFSGRQPQGRVILLMKVSS